MLEEQPQGGRGVAAAAPAAHEPKMAARSRKASNQRSGKTPIAFRDPHRTGRPPGWSRRQKHSPATSATGQLAVAGREPAGHVGNFVAKCGSATTAPGQGPVRSAAVGIVEALRGKQIFVGPCRAD